MAHLHLDKQQRRQYLKAKRRLALNVSKPEDEATMARLFKKPKQYDKTARFSHG